MSHDDGTHSFINNRLVNVESMLQGMLQLNAHLVKLVDMMLFLLLHELRVIYAWFVHINSFFFVAS
jgi:hypothetical protein